MKNYISLRDLGIGEQAVIEKVTATGELGRRLRDMGLTSGAELVKIGKAPLSDPVEIKIRGFNLCLRNNEADGILVSKI